MISLVKKGVEMKTGRTERAGAHEANRTLDLSLTKGVLYH
jgi:hypothetical protein